MTKKITALLMALGVSVASGADNSVNEHEMIIDGKKLELAFEDNFDGNELNSEYWEKCPEWKRCDVENYWDDDMSYLDGNGNLVIETSYDEENDRFLSGAVRTKGKYEQAYGYYEIRCTINTVPGYWTAFWLMGECVGSEKNGGVDGTEIDIYESPYCEQKKIQHTLNWDGYGYAHKYEGKIVNADVYDGEYHTFSLLWTEDEYVYYIDGKESWRTDAKKAKGTCEVPLYMKITAEVGSWAKWSGGNAGPDKDSLPDKMYVDYVRSYRFVD